MALASLAASVRGDRWAAFAWLAAQVFVDSTDGWLARAARVRDRAPQVDGSRLDDIVDYLTYVFVPAWLVLWFELVPSPWAWPVAAAMLVSSGMGFSREDAKTDDHFFTGFPSYWNIVVLYLVALQTGPMFNAAVLLVLAAMVFVPIRYVYPSRTTVWRPVTVALGVAWAVAMLVVMWRMPAAPSWLVRASLLYPAYYVGLSLALEARRARPGH
jgi:phosphatidylcholine synthase